MAVCRPGASLPETSEIETIIANITNVYKNDQTLERGSQRLSELVRRYCEAPQLLEPLAASCLPRLAEYILEQKPEARAALLYMYHIIRARGYKRAVIHLPHEVTNLHPVLTFLESEDPKNNDYWHCRFVLLLWLSIIVMMPFHMSLLDATSNTKGETSKTIMNRIYELCKIYSLVSDACSEAGAFLTSKFLTRSDVREVYLGEFFDWSCKQNADLKDEDNIKYGVLASVATVLKHGKREDLLPYIENLFHWIIQQKYEKSKSISVRKYGIKIIQRIGLTLMRPKLATWRYIREPSSLALNLQLNNDFKSHNTEQNSLYSNNVSDDSGDEDIPEQMEDIIEHLLMGLRDGDNVVRWSAAKGIGRVTARLSCSAARDIIFNIMDLFGPHEGDGAWHGGCLALAELGRRGLLLTCHLDDAVKVVLQALQYEEVRGHTPTGRHVRDAACYVCWAFVRAYSDDLNPFIHELILGIMNTALFDREINCRLAARAAFEESVGRLQIINSENLPILTADEFFLSSTKKAYLCAAPYIATINKKYIKSLIDHLVDKKVNHWDINIRELTSKSLHLVTDKDPTYIIEQILPKLLTKTNSTDLNTRHGSILAIGEIMNALYLNGLNKISSTIFNDIKIIVPTLKAKYQFRGLGGELMLQASSVCIENLSLSRMKYHGDPIIDEWLELIKVCLEHEVGMIRSKAISALSALFNEYLNENSFDGKHKVIKSSKPINLEKYGEYKALLKEKRRELIMKYCEQLLNIGSNGLQIRMGYSLAIGALPSFALEEHLPFIISSLIKCAEITESTLKWAESRRDALKGLTNICKTVGIKKIETIKGDSEYGVHAIFKCMLNSLNEYTIEMRGDIGAWVREASIAGLLSLTKQCAEEDISLFNPDLVSQIMIGIAQQSVEKIDRTRAHAGKAFTALLYCQPSIPYIPHHSELLKVFPKNLDYLEKSNTLDNETVAPGKFKIVDEEIYAKSTVLWLFPEHTMPLFIKLLDWEVFRYKLILGLTVSAGEMTESLVKHSTSALFSYLTPLNEDKEKMTAICNTIVQILIDNHKNDRIMFPMFKFLDRLLSSGCIGVILEDTECDFADNILEHVKIEMKNCRNIYKLLDCISVLCQIIQVGGIVCKKSLAKLLICICNMDKYVRKATATKLYDALLIYGDSTLIPEENMDQVMELLAETNWELEISELKSIRNQLCSLMDIPQPVLIKNTK